MTDWQCGCKTPEHELCGKVMATRRGYWMTTFSGMKFWPEDPRPEEILILDIAHALSNLCRFGGHCWKFYSVAQHSVLVSERLATIEEKRWGLLHDAAEAYMQDLVPAIKGRITGYKTIEGDLASEIFHKFGLTKAHPASIKEVDVRMLATEARDLMPLNCLNYWRLNAVPYDDLTIAPWDPTIAKKHFLSRFADLFDGSFSV